MAAQELLRNPEGEWFVCDVKKVEQAIATAQMEQENQTIHEVPSKEGQATESSDPEFLVGTTSRPEVEPWERLDK